MRCRRRECRAPLGRGNRSGYCAACAVRSTCPICEKPSVRGRTRWCRDCKAGVALALAIHTQLCPPGPRHERHEERMGLYMARAAAGEPLFASARLGGVA